MNDYKQYLSMLPEHMRGAMERYIDHGIPPGSFLWAVLCNDLKGAAGRADMINRHQLPAYIEFLYNYAPASCWGSEDKATEWLTRGGLHGGPRITQNEGDIVTDAVTPD